MKGNKGIRFLRIIKEIIQYNDKRVWNLINTSLYMKRMNDITVTPFTTPHSSIIIPICYHTIRKYLLYSW